MQKLYAALAALVAVGASVTADGDVSINDAFAMASAALGALGVYTVGYTGTRP